MSKEFDKVEEHLSAIEKGPEPKEVVEPIAARLQDIEARINDITDQIKRLGPK